MKTCNETNKAIDFVRDGNLSYYLRAYGFSLEFAKIQFKPFSSEDLKDAFYKLNEEPDEPRIWGSVFRELSRNKLIIHNGWQTYKNPKGHCKPSAVWISREYSEKQSENRMANGKNQIKLPL